MTTAPATNREVLPRPNVLALPTSTTVRMTAVAVTLMVSALFVGTAVHNALLGQTWEQVVRSCLEPTNALAGVAEQPNCRAPAGRMHALVALLTAAIAVVLAVAVIAIAPVAVRRRRRLVPADQRFGRAVQAAADLAEAAGVRPPGVLIMPGTAGQPFCLGFPGQYRIALPRKLALLGNPALFEALVRHEIAHLKHRDVALSWLARALAYVLGPMLVLPIAVALVQSGPALAVDILWRGSVLLVVVVLDVRGLMRARECDADLRASQQPGVERVLKAELSRATVTRTGWRAALAWHPEAARRRAVLEDPTIAARLVWADGLSLGFLVTFALPIVSGIASAGLLRGSMTGQSALTGALLLGPIFGTTVGVGLWRQALATRGTGGRTGVGSVALGVLAGGVLGQLTSLAGGQRFPYALLVLPVALTGITVLVAGLGELWIWGIGRTQRPSAVWVPAGLLGAAAATVVLWAAPQAQSALEGGGWALLVTWLAKPEVLPLSNGLSLPGAVATTLAVATGWALRPGRDTSVPSWWGGASGRASAPGRGAVLAGLVAGLVAGTTLAAYRAVLDPPTSLADSLQRFDAMVLVPEMVGVAVVVILGLTRGPAGAAAGLLAGAVAALTTGGGLLVTVAASGGDPLPLAGHVLGGPIAAEFLIAVPAAIAGAGSQRMRSTAVLASMAVVAGAAMAVTAMADRAALVPDLSKLLPVYSELQVDHPVPRLLYGPAVARPLIDGRAATAEVMRRLRTEHAPTTTSLARIRADVLPTLRSMLDRAQIVRIDDPEVREVHVHAVAGARLHLLGFELLAEAIDRDSRALQLEGNARLAEGNAEWDRWAAGVLTL